MTPGEAVTELDHTLSQAGLEDTRIQSEVLVMHLLLVNMLKNKYQIIFPGG